MAEPNERPAPTKDTSRPVPGASGRFGEPNEDIGQGHMATNNTLEGAVPGSVGMAPDSPSQPNTTGIGSEIAEAGAEAAGGSVFDKRPPENKRSAQQQASPEQIGERLRDASS